MYPREVDGHKASILNAWLALTFMHRGAFHQAMNSYLREGHGLFLLLILDKSETHQGQMQKYS